MLNSLFLTLASVVLLVLAANQMFFLPAKYIFFLRRCTFAAIDFAIP